MRQSIPSQGKTKTQKINDSLDNLHVDETTVHNVPETTLE